MVLLAQPVPLPSAPATPAPLRTADAPETVEEATDLVWTTIVNMWETFVANIPLILIGLVVLVVGWFLARHVSRWSKRGMQRTGSDVVVANLVERLVRILVVVLAALLALHIAGVSVSAALAGLGIAGLAVALAMQGILENFVAGMILIMRKPFRAGDEIAVGDLVGVVEDIDLRTTRLRDYDGELIIIPNATVFSESVVNYTNRARRRSSVAVGVDYRDDHDAVGALLERAVADVDGVLPEPAVMALCTELGDSSVNFEVYYWTLPRIGEVVRTRDRVVRATKSVLDANGFTIPWPIRTLVVDDLDDNVLHHRAVGPG